MAGCTAFRRLLLIAFFLFPSGLPAAPRETLFNDGWRFMLGEQPGAEAASHDDSKWRQVTLPHDWSIEHDFSATFASATGYLPGGIGWYRKQFITPPTAGGMRVTVRFEGVYRNSETWLNGVLLGSRPNGYINFEYDLTSKLAPPGQPNSLVVKVSREDVADSRWYPGTGIYRDVWLTVTDPVHVARHGIFLTTPVVTDELAEVTSTCEVVNDSATTRDVTVIARVIDATGAMVSSARTGKPLTAGEGWTFPLYHPVAKPQRWSPAEPALYQVIHSLEVAGRVVDEVTTPLGIRTARFDANEGFFLNGKPLRLQGVCLHHDAGNLGAAVPRAVLQRRLKILKDIGINAIRCSHNPMADDLYELCDELGLLVMDEAFDEWELGKRKWVSGRNVGTAGREGYNRYFEEWSIRDLEAAVKRARQHPAVICYSIGNEIDYPTDPYVHPRSRQVEMFKDDPNQPSMTRLAAVAPGLIAAVKRLDPTRPVTMAIANASASNAVGLTAMLDVVGYNYQEEIYGADHAAFPGRPLLGSENGHGIDAWLAARDKPFIAGQFLWTGFDFLGESAGWPSHGSTAGLFDTAGFPKPTAHLREALWSPRPVLHLQAFRSRSRTPRSHWNEIPGERSPARVVAFSNLSELTLTLNGRSLGVAKPVNGAAEWSVPWQPGVLEVTGRSADQRPWTDRLATTGPAARLQVTADRSQLRGDGRDAVHLTIELLDAQGRLVTDDDRRVTVTVTAPLVLAALENGDMRDNTPATANTRMTRAGRALAIIQARSSGDNPPIRISADNLPTADFALEKLP